MYLFRVLVNPFKITIIVQKKFKNSIKMKKVEKSYFTFGFFFGGRSFNQKATKKREILNLKK